MQPAIEVLGVRKTYVPTVAVDEASFEVHEGEMLGLIGPNGAGKTTTIACFLRPCPVRHYVSVPSVTSAQGVDGRA
jgi:branched-chain amino acid transport system ATP-binding protein